ncbi:ABC transporter ATP-binding protein [Neolewinella antarctica]|uniref:ABC transport system ATP-binding protein n=1 Tax=Neolewinella antarctica TaxID=442734 RepID=A0ABX0X8R1_9BACT|nr:ABC transporter ATP-binding protein [Neolewinella antarctica]NJC25617.1 putative ABC transport system ATP-binding protein [Neolewinella antarctica]
MSATPTVVSLRDVHKIHYTAELQTAALNGLNLNIAQGEFVAIMGPSGSGKSTLLNVVGMIDEPSRGTYNFLGTDVTTLSRRKRAAFRKNHMGFIFQSFNLIDELSAFENVELPLVYLKVPTAERRERVNRALSELEMGHRAGHYPRQLSGGQQQRVAIARAIVTNPSLILADEPTGNLDSENSRSVMRKLKEFHAGGATIVMVTHAMKDAGFAGRVVELFDGKVLGLEKEFLAR